MKKVTTGVVLSLFVVILLVPAPASALNIWEGAYCDGGENIQRITDGGPVGSCTICDAYVVAKNIITFLIELSFTIAVAMIVWGAIQMIISTGNPGKVSQAKSIMINALIGLAIALASWLIINTIITVLAPGHPMLWNQIQCG